MLIILLYIKFIKNCKYTTIFGSSIADYSMEVYLYNVIYRLGNAINLNNSLQLNILMYTEIVYTVNSIII